MLYIQEISPNYRGVFCSQLIKNGDLIETCPVIVIPKTQVSRVDKTVLYDYYFIWGEQSNEAALALGYGSLYNHSTNANAVYVVNFIDREIYFLAVKDIDANTEITVNYNGTPDDTAKVWFEKD